MEVSVLKRLGKGTFADVYRMEFSSGHLKYQVALKVIECRKSPQDNIKDEVDILKSLQHNKIVRYFTAFQHKDNFFILLENCNGGELYEYLKTRRPNNYLPDEEVLDLACQTAEAIQFLHQNHIIHRDLKTTNIFLNNGNNVKIGDFGISRQLESTIDVTNSFVGTPLYMAPEILNHQSYNYKADSWSFGCCLHELMSLHYAFEAGEDTRKNILKAKFSPLPSRYGEDLKQLVRRLLQTEQTKRFDMKDAYCFLQGMIENPKQRRHENLDYPKLPGKEAVVEALKKFKIKEIQDSYEDEKPSMEDGVYSDRNETLRNTVQPASNPQQHQQLEGDIALAREISNGLRENLDCLKIDHQQMKDESAGKPNFVRKKKSFLKEKSQSAEETITKRYAATEPVTLYTRGQRVLFKKSEEDDISEDVREFGSTLEEKCCKEVGSDKFSRAMSLVHVVKSASVLESQLREILGTSNYKKFKNIFVKPPS